MIRVVNCINRSLKKYFSVNVPVEIKPKKRCRDNSSQTATEEKTDKLAFCSTPELDSLKELSDKLQHFKFSRVTRKLCDLYDSIVKMHTDIPSPPDTPGGYNFDIGQATKLIEENINEFHKRLTVKMAKKNSLEDTSKDAEIQTDAKVELLSVRKSIAQPGSESEVDAAL